MTIGSLKTCPVLTFFTVNYTFWLDSLSYTVAKLDLWYALLRFLASCWCDSVNFTSFLLFSREVILDSTVEFYLLVFCYLSFCFLDVRAPYFKSSIFRDVYVVDGMRFTEAGSYLGVEVVLTFLPTRLGPSWPRLKSPCTFCGFRKYCAETGPYSNWVYWLIVMLNWFTIWFTGYPAIYCQFIDYARRPSTSSTLGDWGCVLPFGGS